MIYGITGGIAAGKTFVCRLLAERGYPIFYCDEVAKTLMQTDNDLQQTLKTLIGTAIFSHDGALNKPLMREYLQTAGTATVNAVVHPRVQTAFLAWVAQQTAPALFMESAILFESGFDRLVDHTVLVAAPEAVRIARLMQRNHFSEAQARQWLALQMDEEEKKRLADFVIINDGQTDLESQINKLLAKDDF